MISLIVITSLYSSFISISSAANNISLGSASNFVILAGNGIANSGNTVVLGDMGTYPSLSYVNSGSVFELVADTLSVDQVAVVGQRHRAVRTDDMHWLGVFGFAGAGGGVAGVTDRDVAREVSKIHLVEDLRHEAHPGLRVNFLAVCCGDPGAFLAAVLQSVDAVKGDASYVGVAVSGGVYPKDAALFLPDRTMHGHAQRRW